MVFVNKNLYNIYGGDILNISDAFEKKGQWYKANLHTHSTASDAQFSINERIEQYSKKGYDVLALTDHGVISNVQQLAKDDLLIINGAELHPKCENGEKWHLVCLNLSPDFNVQLADCD